MMSKERIDALGLTEYRRNASTMAIVMIHGWSKLRIAHVGYGTRV